MAEAGDSDHVAGPSGTLRPSFALGRGPAGRLLPNPPPPGRLTSLRSRDLTLGGYKKKTFVPNVNSIRKNKDELKAETHVTPKTEKRKREDRQKEWRRREKPQTIQSHSIFEQGPADTFKKAGSWGASNLSDCDPAALTRSVKKEKNADDDDDCKILEKLHRDDFIDDPGLKNDPRQEPIRLPLHQSCHAWSTRTSASLKEASSPQSTGTASHHPPTVGELFQRLNLSQEEELMFIQLPDTIPGPRKAASETIPKTDGKAEDKSAAQLKTQDRVEEEATPVLSDLSEGPIGKLQIRRSGRVQLVMGDVTLDVSEGAAFSFLQQLVCVRLTEGRTGDLTVLGNVKHKLVCSPDFEALLHGVKASPHTKPVSS
ncbi:DNA-directed RNA polymerase III subunit RPC4 [Trichomycterus rosablanca]|uniref:DNA-directed RNA polymerase III subunit RPC4 n=1 Tax=Trichomycterus rosablanca TaxID=2290929 RepID=UPI002F353333